jgi:hypothetical protein
MQSYTSKLLIAFLITLLAFCTHGLKTPFTPSTQWIFNREDDIQTTWTVQEYDVTGQGYKVILYTELDDCEYSKYFKTDTSSSTDALTVYRYTGSGNPDKCSFDNQYSPAIILYQSTNYTQSIQLTGSSTDTIQITGTVTNGVSVTVPLGTFSAVRVAVTQTTSSYQFTETYWIDLESGLIVQYQDSEHTFKLSSTVLPTSPSPLLTKLSPSQSIDTSVEAAVSVDHAQSSHSTSIRFSWFVALVVLLIVCHFAL